MAITEYATRPVPQIIAHKVTRPRETKKWIDWVTTTDHKKIGIMYLILTFVFFALGGVEALIMRVQLSVPNNTLVTPEKYNQLLTMHGTTMIFLFVVPVMAGFGNYFVPLMIGARDMAFPRLNALSFWLLAFGGVVFYATIANMRAKGMSWGRLPLFIWAILTYSVLIIFAMPVIAGAPPVAKLE